MSLLSQGARRLLKTSLQGVFISSLFLGTISYGSNLDYLEFPAELNNLQALPQKFEYSLRDASKLLLGNRIIDTNQFFFEIVPSPNSVQLNLRWPINVIESGRVVMLNPSGVAIWSQNISQESNGSLSIPNSMSLLQKLMGYSFFRFCVGYYDISTGMDVCSPELTIRGTDKSLRASYRRSNGKASVQINGRSVTPHGIVFLNDTKESLSFRATAASGAVFKMDTRRINLSFPDVIQVDDHTIQVTVEGQPPIAPTSYKVISDDKWSILLRKERPLFYVAGEGEVPLRQEFVVQGPLPTEAHRLNINRNSAKKSYSSKLTLTGTIGERGTPQSSSENSEVFVSGSKFTWVSRNISTGHDRKSYIQVVDGSDVFTAAYPVSTYPPSRIEVFAGLNSDDMRFYLGAEAQTWIESLPLLDTWTTQRIGLGLLYNQDITGDKKTILTELDLFYRFKTGLQMVDPSWILGLGIQNFSFDSETVQSFSPIVAWHGHAAKWAKGFRWQELELRYTLPTTGSSLDLKQNIMARWKLYQDLKDNQALRYSLGAYSQTLKASKDSNLTGAVLEAAWVKLF